MGMKSKSGHFGNTTGGPSIRQGFHPRVNLQFFSKMPKRKDQINHIMADRKGHITNSKKNRQLLEKISSDNKNFIRSDPRGFKIYAKVINGNEYWVHVRRGVIQNGGMNLPGEFRYKSSNNSKKGGK